MNRFLVSFGVLLLVSAVAGQGASTGLLYPAIPSNNDLFGINFNWWVRGDVYNNQVWPAGTIDTANPYNNSYLHKFLKGIGSTITRFPGGTTSTFWNVTSSAFVDPNSPVCQTMAASSVYTTKCTNYNAATTANAAMGGPDAMTLLAFGQNMAQYDMDWIYVANLYTTDAQAIIDAIELVCANNNPACPTYLELGNEYYLANYFPTALLPNSSVYMDRCRQVYEAVADYFPGRISALTSYSGFAGSQPTNVNVQWNQGLFHQDGVAYDDLTIHIYTLQGSNLASNPTWSWYTVMFAWPETAFRVTYNKYITQFPNAVKLWVTEFNYNAAVSASTGSDALNFAANARWQPSHALVVAGFYLSMFEYADVFSKALLFETIRDGFLSNFLIDSTGTSVYAPGQIYTHMAHIMKNADTYSSINFSGVDKLPALSWYNSYVGTVYALQGAIFFGSNNSGLTYIVVNRANYSITVGLTESQGYQSVTIHNYPGNVNITGTLYYPFDIENPQFPIQGPIPVTTIPRANTGGGVSQVAFAPFSLTVVHFDFDVAPTVAPTIPPTPQPTISPVVLCGETVEFEQTLQSFSPYSSQWLVRIHTTSSALYGAQIQVSPAPQSLWGLDQVQGMSNVYTVPSYELENGAVPAGRSCLTFNYMTSGGSTPLNISLINNACSPVVDGCSSTVTNQLVSEWTSNNVLFQQYSINVANTGSKTIGGVSVTLSLNSQTSFYEWWNLSTEDLENFQVATGNVGPSSSNTNAGYQVTTVGGTAGTTYVTLSSSSAVCLAQ